MGLALLLALRPALAQTASEAQEFTLKNGMTLIVKVDPRAPTAVHMLWVRVGSMDEVDGVSGVAHVLEHMLFKGTAKVKQGEFSRRVAALGGRENAFTNKDYTGYYQQIPAKRLAEVMALEADRFANNQWPDIEFTKEIEVVKEERRMRTDDNPQALAMERFQTLALPSSPERNPTIGWMRDLDSLTDNLFREAEPEDLIKFGLIPELVGRLPVVTTLSELTEEALVQILTEPKNALVKQFGQLLNMEGVDLEIRPEALHAIAKKALARKTGARGLRSILEQALIDTMFDLPNTSNVEKVVVDASTIEDNHTPLLVYRESAKQA